MKYLIVKCEPLNDQYECDADRTPMLITDDWKSNIPSYRFEVYGINEDGSIGSPIKDYEEVVEKGMAFGYWEDEGGEEPEDFHWIKKFPNHSRTDDVPADILKKLKWLEEYDDNLVSCGYITGHDSAKMCSFIYGEYNDNRPPIFW